MSRQQSLAAEETLDDSYTEYMSSSGSSEEKTDLHLPPVDPFDNHHRAAHLKKLENPLKDRESFQMINAQCPKFRKNSRVQLGDC